MNLRTTCNEKFYLLFSTGMSMADGNDRRTEKRALESAGHEQTKVEADSKISKDKEPRSCVTSQAVYIDK